MTQMPATTTTIGWPRKLRVLSQVHYAEMMQYRAEIALWAVATMLPLIMMGVWAQAGESGLFPISKVQVFRYFIVVYLIRQITIVWTIHHFEFLVVTGRLSPMLLHPVDPCIRFILMHIGEQLTRLPFAAAIVGIFLFLYPETITGGPDGSLWWPGWQNILLSIIACYTAFILRFFMQYALCMAAFWHERVAAMDAILFLPYMFFSGLIFPFETLPDTLREILLWTPFPYMVWFPATLIVQGEAPILRGFLIMFGWTAAFFILYRYLWHKGLKHYSAMGA
jgi:viologen exporter family transport system permease protein